MHIALGVMTLVVLSASAIDAAPRTGTITGKVTVTEPNGTAAGNPVIVVYVIGPPATAAPEDAKPAVVALEHRSFIPDVVAITAGDSIEFAHRDSMFHNVFSPKPKLDLGTLTRDARAPQRAFAKPAVIDLYCNFHPQEAAVILVLPNRHHTTARRGEFKLEGVPVGKWTVYAYTRRATKPAKIPVEVGAGGITVELSLTRAQEQPHVNKHGESYDRSSR